VFEIGLRLVIVYISAKTLNWLKISAKFLEIGNLFCGTSGEDRERILVCTNLVTHDYVKLQ